MQSTPEDIEELKRETVSKERNGLKKIHYPPFLHAVPLLLHSDLGLKNGGMSGSSPDSKPYENSLKEKS